MADNPEELFDVVDTGDKAIGTATRGEVHARGLLHRAVHILVVREDGALFLQKRSAGKDTFPGRWDSSASGHLDSGESYDPAALREVGEELGVHLGALECLAKLPASPATGQEFVQVYRGRHDGPFTLHPEEIEEGRWLQPDVLDKWLGEEPEAFPPCFHEVWTAVKRHFLET